MEIKKCLQKCIYCIFLARIIIYRKIQVHTYRKNKEIFVMRNFKIKKLFYKIYIFSLAATKPYCFSFAYCSSHHHHHQQQQHHSSSPSPTPTPNNGISQYSKWCRCLYCFANILYITSIYYHFPSSYHTVQTSFYNGSHVIKSSTSLSIHFYSNSVGNSTLANFIVYCLVLVVDFLFLKFATPLISILYQLSTKSHPILNLRVFF